MNHLNPASKNVLKSISISDLFTGHGMTVNGRHMEYSFKSECLKTVATILNHGCVEVSHSKYGQKFYDFGDFVISRKNNLISFQF